MFVLVACEESQRVCTEFRKLGHTAFSCDIIPCSGNHPEWHILGDCMNIINGVCHFRTQAGEMWFILKWDLIIAHPPCTRLCCASNRSRKEKQEETKNAIDFFLKFTNANCDKICIENPVGIMSTMYRGPDQYIQPWQFAITSEENTEKTTCLWLKNLKPLKPLHTEKPDIEYVEFTGKNGRKTRQTKWYYLTRCMKPCERGRAASKTFPGIERAMAEQWGGE